MLWEMSNGVQLEVGEGAGVAFLGSLASMAARGASATQMDEALAEWGGARDGAVWRAALDMASTRRGEMKPRVGRGFARIRKAGVPGDVVDYRAAAKLLGLSPERVSSLVRAGYLTKHMVRCERLGRDVIGVDMDQVSELLGSRVPGGVRSKTTDGFCSWWQQELGSVMVRFGDTSGGRFRFAAISRNETPQIGATGPDGVRTAILCPQWTEMLVLSVWAGGGYLGRFQPMAGRFFRVSCDGDPLLFAEGQMRPVGMPMRGDGAADTFDRMQRWSRGSRKRADLHYPDF